MLLVYPHNYTSFILEPSSYSTSLSMQLFHTDRIQFLIENVSSEPTISGSATGHVLAHPPVYWMVVLFRNGEKATPGSPGSLG